MTMFLVSRARRERLPSRLPCASSQRAALVPPLHPNLSNVLECTRNRIRNGITSIYNTDLGTVPRCAVLYLRRAPQATRTDHNVHLRTETARILAEAVQSEGGNGKWTRIQKAKHRALKHEPSRDETRALIDGDGAGRL